MQYLSQRGLSCWCLHLSVRNARWKSFLELYFLFNSVWGALCEGNSTKRKEKEWRNQAILRLLCALFTRKLSLPSPPWFLPSIPVHFASFSLLCLVGMTYILPLSTYNFIFLKIWGSHLNTVIPLNHKIWPQVSTNSYLVTLIPLYM